MSDSATSCSSTPSNGVESHAWQDQLIEYCQAVNMPPPSWEVLSDRRGGRTAWSTSVIVAGQAIRARFWYDGHFLNSAREDAAEVALQKLGQAPYTSAQQQQQRQQQRQQQGRGRK